jgi:hypothetical protein
MVEYKFISNDIYDYCDQIIINQQLFLSDIYYWFNSKNRKLSSGELLKIKEILDKCDISPRDSILLTNLLKENDKNFVIIPQTNIINESVIETPKVKQKVNVSNSNTISLECNHIIDEYLLIKSIDDLKYFIDNRCVDTINKNKFCEVLINKFFISKKEKVDEIILLIKQLITLRILFKSNYSRGLLLIYNNWDELSIDYDNPIPKIKLFLSTLKSIGITKGLEHLLEKYKI